MECFQGTKQRGKRQKKEGNTRCCDPAAWLHADLMAHVFSFVGGGRGKYEANIAPTYLRHFNTGDDNNSSQATKPNTSATRQRLLRLDEATRLACSHNGLALVSKAWKEVLDTRLSSILGPILGTFYTLRTFRQIEAHLEWIIRHKLSMASFLLYSDSLDLEPNSQLVLQLLERCDTTHLERMAVNLRFSLKDRFKLYDAIARKCSNLKELAIFMRQWELCDDASKNMIMNHPLFHMPSIQWMHLYLSEEMFRGSSGTTLPIATLPALRELRLSGGSGARYHHRLIKLSSTTLEILNLEGLHDHAFVECDCPNLQSFACNTRSGSFPSQWRRLLRERRGRFFQHPFDASTTAGALPFWKLRVPDACMITVAGSRNDWWGNMEDVWQRLEAEFDE